MGDVVCLESYRKKLEEEEICKLQEELDDIIRDLMMEEIEQIGYECYNLTNEEMAELGLTEPGRAYYVVVSPWVFYQPDDELEN